MSLTLALSLLLFAVLADALERNSIKLNAMIRSQSRSNSMATEMQTATETTRQRSGVGMLQQLQNIKPILVQRPRRRQSISAPASLMQTKGPVFPAYPRDSGYVHPLDAIGQTLEKQMVKRLTPDLTMDYLKKVVEFPTRSYTHAAASQQVEDFLKDNFHKMGITTCFHTFRYGANQLTNVVGYVPGATSQSVVVGAHYDSRPFDGNAPGAEDNGSGVAALLSVAHAFMSAGIKPRKSIYFVAFAGEEPGLIGSQFFANALNYGGQGIPDACLPNSSTSSLLERGIDAPATTQAIIMDEVGWESKSLQRPTVNLESYDWSKPVMDELRESSQTHNGDELAVVHSNHPFGSDHMSFLNNQMKAVLTINGDDEAYPHYHQSTDTINNVNAGLMAMISKMNLGAMIRLAGLQIK